MLSVSVAPTVKLAQVKVAVVPVQATAAVAVAVAVQKKQTPKINVINTSH